MLLSDQLNELLENNLNSVVEKTLYYSCSEILYDKVLWRLYHEMYQRENQLFIGLYRMHTAIEEFA